MRNTGISTWTQANGYKLGAVGDSDPFCAFTRVDLEPSDSIAVNQEKTFSFTMTAPSTPGTYTTDWRMLREGVEWFGGHADQAGAGAGDGRHKHPAAGSPARLDHRGTKRRPVRHRRLESHTANDYIYWHLPHSVTWGAVEFYVSGLISRDPISCRATPTLCTCTTTLTARTRITSLSQ